MRFAVRHDVVRLTVGAFARWCTVTREIRAHKRDVRARRHFIERRAKSGAFFNMRQGRPRGADAQRGDEDASVRAMARGPSLARENSRHAPSSFSTRRRSVSTTSTCPRVVSGVWRRPIASARGRRYAAMEFEETWCARRAFVTWRRATTRDDDVEPKSENENESSTANAPVRTWSSRYAAPLDPPRNR